MNIKLSNDALGRPNLEEYQLKRKAPVYVILDNVRSAQNVGSIFRTMDAFGCAKIYLCGITPTPPHREINKTALGATTSVEWAYHENTEGAINEIRSLNGHVYAVEQTIDSTNLENIDEKLERIIAFVFGNEVDGVDQKAIELCDESIEIQQFGTKHSLNIAVCAGIVLWHVAGRKQSR